MSFMYAGAQSCTRQRTYVSFIILRLDTSRIYSLFATASRKVIDYSPLPQ